MISMDKETIEEGVHKKSSPPKFVEKLCNIKATKMVIWLERGDPPSHFEYRMVPD